MFFFLYSTYDISTSELVNRWPNHSSKSHRITSACVINTTESFSQPMLAVATDDGSVRVWNDPFTCTRHRIRDYALKDPYFKSLWLEAKSNTCTSKTSKTCREYHDAELLSSNWKKKGSNLFIGSTFVGDSLGGFLGESCRQEDGDALRGGYFSKGYSWPTSIHNSSLGSSPSTIAHSPASGGWGSSPWSSGAAAVTTPVTPVNGWTAGGTGALDSRALELARINPRMVTAFTATANVSPGMKGQPHIVTATVSPGMKGQPSLVTATAIVSPGLKGQPRIVPATAYVSPGMKGQPRMVTVNVSPDIKGYKECANMYDILVEMYIHLH